MTKMITHEGEPFAMLVEDPQHGRYLVPPIVLDDQGNVTEGHDVLAAMRQAGVHIQSTDGGVWKGRTPAGAEVMHPCLIGKISGDLARIDQVMTGISTTLGAPIWPRA